VSGASPTNVDGEDYEEDGCASEIEDLQYLAVCGVARFTADPDHAVEEAAALGLLLECLADFLAVSQNIVAAAIQEEEKRGEGSTDDGNQPTELKEELGLLVSLVGMVEGQGQCANQDQEAPEEFLAPLQMVEIVRGKLSIHLIVGYWHAPLQRNSITGLSFGSATVEVAQLELGDSLHAAS
jgi:hypothetical protein